MYQALDEVQGLAKGEARTRTTQKVVDTGEASAATKGIEDRVTTADIICGVLRNERPVSDLRNYLTKP